MSRRPWLWLLLTILASALSGCASPPPLRPVASLQSTVEVPPSWQNQVLLADENPAAAADWWERFDDQRIRSVVREALAHNHSLGVALANVEAARANATIAGAGRWPQLNGTARAARSKQIFVGLPLPGAGPASSLSSSYSLGLEASWEIDLWNRLGQQAQASVAQWQASEAELRGARSSVAAQSVRSWVAVVEARRLCELGQRSVDADRQTAELIGSRYDRGLATSADLYLSRAQLEAGLAQQEDRQLRWQQSRRSLEVLLGRYPRAEIESGAELPRLGDLPPARLPADLLERRPDLIAAERRLIASGALTRAARRNLLPRITLTGSTGSTSNQLSDLLDGDFSVWSLAGGLVQPLLQGGRLRAQVRAQHAAEEASLAQYANAVLSAFAEVENALDAEARLARREQYLQAAVDAAQRAASLADDRYRRGVGTLLQLLDSRQRALESEGQLVSTEAQRLRQRVDLHIALGGDFVDHDETPAPPESSR